MITLFCNLVNVIPDFIAPNVSHYAKLADGKICRRHIISQLGGGFRAERSQPKRTRTA